MFNGPCDHVYSKRKLLFFQQSVYTPPTSYMLGGKLPGTVHPRSGQCVNVQNLTAHELSVHPVQHPWF